MLKTHTGTRIDTARFSWSCGNWSVPYIGIAERRPGRARQMRRMVAKARRRERRGYVPPAVKRARLAREARLKAHGFDDPTADECKANLALNVALRDWPKDDEP